MANARQSRETTAHPGSKRRLKLWVAFIALFMAWAIYTLVLQMEHSGRTALQLAGVQDKLAEGEQENAKLQQAIDRLGDPEYIRELARKEQGMIVPGEKPIHVTGRVE
ncbi:septum formation initiator [Paenibacillus darwinianus]|uniref:Septum formation initiator n=1 Tax=Paenibacillus darwinianus TaxID=1380763 RepID=A0A9W5S150_9BACL|nr:septum formation initiator family protein [Paenibacillus darwinianus]EXX85044.1 septum formation initiator [Paenibacillus darwinianus]EXX87602.1 septum formation initiator [Paenibacillus darwinianus]EXX87660.1 septum formation initiator [Paenibacillus darwinianus]